MKKKDFNGLRKYDYIIFVGAIWVGCKMYHVCGNDEIGGWDFHTKKEAAEFIKKNFSGDECAIRLYDLRNCVDMYNPKNVK